MQFFSKITSMLRWMEIHGFLGKTDEWWKANGTGVRVRYVKHRIEKRKESYKVPTNYGIIWTNTRWVTVCIATWEIVAEEEPIVPKEQEEMEEKVIPGGKRQFEAYLSFAPTEEQMEEMEERIFTAYFVPGPWDSLDRYWVDCDKSSFRKKRRNRK